MTIPEGLYPGDYLKPVGEALAAEFGASLRDKPEAEWLPLVRARAIAAMMAMIRDDLAALGIDHEVFSSERALTGADGGEDQVRAAIEDLRRRGIVYEGRLPPPKGEPSEDWEDREQTLFRSTDFGDDVDRPLIKSDGGYTYFASDIAYHKTKIDRGFLSLVDVWGADHGGYVKRMQAAVAALSGGKADLDVRLCQLVRLMRAGEPVKMSKRSGDFVTLREVVDEVGADPVRFIMLMRKNDATLDFDLAKVIEQSQDNPVFYVQYAHARARSVLRQARAAFPDLDLAPRRWPRADFGLLVDEGERGLMRALAQFPRVVVQAAEAREPHRIAFYAHDLATLFHSHWNRGKDSPHLRFVNEGNASLTECAHSAGDGDGLCFGFGVDYPGRERARGNALERPIAVARARRTRGGSARDVGGVDVLSASEPSSEASHERFARQNCARNQPRRIREAVARRRSAIGRGRGPAGGADAAGQHGPRRRAARRASAAVRAAASGRRAGDDAPAGLRRGLASRLRRDSRPTTPPSRRAPREPAFAEPAPARGSRGWGFKVTGMIVVGVALLAGGAALKHGVPGLPKAPPFIAADNAPTKVQPPNEANVQSNGDIAALLMKDSATPTPVKVVNTEEQPVDLRTQTQPPTPAPSAPAGAPNAVGAAPTPAADAGSPVATAPDTPIVPPAAASASVAPLFPVAKPVKTVSVRPDGTLIAAADATPPAAAPAPDVVPTPPVKTAVRAVDPIVATPEAATPKLDLPTKLSPKSQQRVVAKTDTTAPNADASATPSAPLQLVASPKPGKPAKPAPKTVAEASAADSPPADAAPAAAAPTVAAATAPPPPRRRRRPPRKAAANGRCSSPRRARKPTRKARSPSSRASTPTRSAIPRWRSTRPT